MIGLCLGGLKIRAGGHEDALGIEYAPGLRVGGEFRLVSDGPTGKKSPDGTDRAGIRNADRNYSPGKSREANVVARCGQGVNGSNATPSEEDQNQKARPPSLARYAARARRFASVEYGRLPAGSRARFAPAACDPSILPQERSSADWEYGPIRA